MCKYRLLQEFRKNGTLKAAINLGLISTTVLRHEKIFKDYLRLKAKYESKEDLNVTVAENNRCDKRTVERVVKDFGC